MRAIYSWGHANRKNTTREWIWPSLDQVLYAFLWSMALNQEPIRTMAATCSMAFDITLSSVDRVLKRVSQATVHPSDRFIRWPNGECQ